MQLLKQEAAGPEGVVTNDIGGWKAARTRKMFAAVFGDVDTTVHIYSNKGKNNETPNGVPERIVKRQEKKTYALVVEGKETDYRDVLKNVKAALINSTAASSIKGLRSTRDGKRLVISTDKDTSALENVQKTISEMADSFKVKKYGGDEDLIPIHIKGMDVLSTKDDVIAALEKKIGSLLGVSYRLSDFRPNMNNTLAITLFIGKKESDKVVENGILRVGLATCRAERRVKVSDVEGAGSTIIGNTSATTREEANFVTAAAGKDTPQRHARTKKHACSVGQLDTGRIPVGVGSFAELSLTLGKQERGEARKTNGSGKPRRWL